MLKQTVMVGSNNRWYGQKDVWGRWLNNASKYTREFKSEEKFEPSSRLDKSRQFKLCSKFNYIDSSEERRKFKFKNKKESKSFLIQPTDSLSA